MKKILLLTCMFVSMFLQAQKDGLSAISSNRLKANMTFLASDNLKGREMPSGENEIAALFLKAKLMEMGLSPIAETGDYYQPMAITSKTIDKTDTFLKLFDAAGNEVFSTDSLATIFTPGSTLDVCGGVVFAGYGCQNKETGYDDLQDVEVKDKIVLIMTRNPKMVEEGSGDGLFDYKEEFPKLGRIAKAGAKAILYVYDPKNKFPDVYASGYAGLIGSEILSTEVKPARISKFQYAFITPHAANLLLKTTGHQLAELQDMIDRTGKPFSMDIPERLAQVKTGVVTRDFVANNVIGMIEGSDPGLKDECIIYTAHFDHEGPNERGEILNGADDNASGTVALLEIARAYKSLKNNPRRTIVFAWLNGEDRGLIGSQYYVEKPIVPLEKTLMDINLDMIGRTKLPSDTGTFHGYELTVTESDKVLMYSVVDNHEILDKLQTAAKDAGMEVIAKENLELGASDHNTFEAKGVPAFLFISGIHADVHTPHDDIERIDFGKIDKLAKMVFEFGYSVANQKGTKTVAAE